MSADADAVYGGRVVTVSTVSIAGLDVALPLAVHIAGTVTHGSSPVSGLDVYFYDPDMNQIAHATTDASGHYSQALPPGDYYIQFWDTSLTYPNGWWSHTGFTQVEVSSDLLILDAVSPETTPETDLHRHV